MYNYAPFAVAIRENSHIIYCPETKNKKKMVLAF